jgi:hypothetical protein
MRDGAFGLSTGLFYVPGAFTPLEEIVELQKIVAPFRGVHTSHMRDEATDVVKSVKETIAIVHPHRKAQRLCVSGCQTIY